MKKRVVITGMGVAAPNAHGLDAFEQALREGRSGIRFQPLLEELKFGCQIAGIPENFDAIRKSYFDHEKLMSINDNIGYASVSAVECTATDLIPISWQARITRSAISPRLAIRIFSNMGAALIR